jgi:hypothetical protein
VARWLLDQGVPVDNTLRVGAHPVDLPLAEELLRRGASVDASALSSALDNEDEAVTELLARTLAPGAGHPEWLLERLRRKAAQAGPASGRAAVLARVADRLS